MSTSVSAVNQLLALAKDQFGDDFDSNGTEVDTKFFTSAADGTHADYGDYKGGKDANNPAKAEDWGPKRTLEANRIGWLFLDNEAVALVSQKGIQVQGARIDGALDLRQLHFECSMMFRHCTFVQPPDFSNASFNALYLPGTHCPGIVLNGLHLKRSLHLRDGFVANGEVNLGSGFIGGHLDCSGGSFLNKGGTALNANAITVSATVFLGDEFKAEGEVNLCGASIGGQLDCGGGTFLNKGGTALNANAITVMGDVFLRASIVEGEVNQLVNIRVQGELDFARADIKGSLQYRNLEKPEEATLALSHAKAGVLWDDPESWPDPGNLWLHGFEYDALSDEATVDAKQRIDWLGRDTREAEDFSPQPYEQLAKVV